MTKKAWEAVSEEQVLTLLSIHPKGLDINSITQKLNSDIRQIKPMLVSLQQRNLISSGFKKIEGQVTSFFDRYYFCYQ